ncbi:MAG: hypothetical protein JRK26_22315 [Deltaproteobacteria bacterium]|nr:hypothetical protein [Deltaproteobacteria bacterium]
MKKWQFKYEMYHHLAAKKAELFEEARKIPGQIGMPEEWLRKYGLTGMISENHGLLRREIAQAIEDGARKIVSNAVLDVEVRRLVKTYYGDEYDAITANTCEGLLYLCFDVLAAPPLAGRGDNYRARYIAPYERHAHHQAAYGRPFPPKYKDLYADRGVTAGEYGQMGKRLYNLETILVPLAGARYECHGIKYHPCPLLLEVDAAKSAEKIAEEAKNHITSLSAFTSLGYTFPGYGYGEKDDDGVPILQKSISQLAAKYNVPYIMDRAAESPFLCTDIRNLGADVMVFSMDKASGAPTCGLAIGKEESMVPLARAVGTHGHRYGIPYSHGKAAYVTLDPGKEALLGLIATLKCLMEKPDTYKKAVDLWYDITIDEFSKLDSGIREGLVITKDYGQLAVEVNYEKTWADGKMGLPIFSIEDMYAGTALTQSGVSAMGVIACVAYDANIKMNPGLGTTDEKGQLVEEPTRYCIRALVKFIELLARYAGVLDQ